MPHAPALRPTGPKVSAEPGEDEFRLAVAGVGAGLKEQCELRPELSFETEPPPRRLAPFAHAVAVTVTDPVVASGRAVVGNVGHPGPGDLQAEIGWGKFVLLFDAAGQQGWDGQYRVIGYVRAELEPEMAADPLINAVGWSWLTEALDAWGNEYRKISGTVTTVVTQGFGAKQNEPTSTEFELRASWSPAAGPGQPADLRGHVAAWCDVVCQAAGLPPLPPGVAAFRPQRRRLQP